ncbi:MAG: hypothetical protein OEW77_12680, partial [Gemmatimonadota bacterium]|nr:hypothetical protein [Gemmatimonadota bacterium]
MGMIINWLDFVRGLLRTGFNGILVVSFLGALTAWLVRAKHVSPFGGVGRFARSVLDPLIAPVEARIIRAGGSARSAPWWALVFVFLA